MCNFLTDSYYVLNVISQHIVYTKNCKKCNKQKCCVGCTWKPRLFNCKSHLRKLFVLVRL